MTLTPADYAAAISDMLHDDEKTAVIMIPSRLATATLALIQWLTEDWGEIPMAMVPVMTEINNWLGEEQYRQLHE